PPRHRRAQFGREILDWRSWRSSYKSRRGAKGRTTQRFPAAALSASGSKGLLSPGQAKLLGQDPYVARTDVTPSGGGLASVSTQLRGRIANVIRMQLRSPSRL